jgi:hypothetical protein
MAFPSPVAEQWEKVPDRADEGLCPRNETSQISPFDLKLK